MSVSTITQKEYNKLSDEEKKNYVEYNSSATDKDMASTIKESNMQLEALDKLNPMYEKMKFMPNPLPGEQLNEMVEKIEKMESLVEPVEKLAKNKYVGVLVKPLVDLINALFSVIGELLVIQSGLMKGTEFLTDSICETCDQTDWEGLKNTMSNIKETKSENAAEEKKKETKKETKEEPSQMSQKCTEAKEAVAACWDSLQIADASSRIYKKTVELSAKKYTWKEYKEKTKKVAKALGVDFDRLDRPSEADMKTFEKIFPDPKKTGKKMADKLNKLVHEKEYISIADNKKLQEQQKLQTQYNTVNEELTKLNKKYDDYIHGTGEALTAEETAQKTLLTEQAKILLKNLNA